MTTFTTPRTWAGGYNVLAADLNEQIRDNLLALDELIPIGVIFSWKGSIASIPTGWGLCDGGGGRKDLRDKFVPGAGSTYAVDATGGANTGAPSSHSAHSVGQASTHGAHIVVGPTAHSAPSRAAASATVTGSGDFNHIGAATDAHTSHTGAGLDAHSAHDTGTDIRPSYWAKAYMQKTASALSSTPRTWVTGEVPTAAYFNTTRDLIVNLYERLMPLGVLGYTDLSVASIPLSWLNCDGAGGTNDLRGRILVGAGSAYAVDATGGGATATLATHTTHVGTQPAAHSAHIVTQPSAHTSTPNFTVASTTVIVTTFTHTGFDVDAHSAHSGFGASAGHDHTPMAVLPPYMALNTIERITHSYYTTPRTWTASEIVLYSYFNLFRDQLRYLRDGPFAGLIGLWSASIASIPAGWLHCSGAAGTPDLRDRFVLGASATYTLNSTGGALSVTPAAHSNHTVVNAATHTQHVPTYPAAHTTAATGSTFNASAIMTSGSHSTGLTVSAGHDHSGATIDAHSAHSSVATLPVYKALAYVKKS